MKFLNKLERKLGRFAIANLMLYIIVLNLATFFMIRVAPQTRYLLSLSPYLIRQGEYWRLISFIAYPPNTSVIFLAFALYLSYLIGMSLENEWGSFRFNIFYLLGIIGTIACAFIANTTIMSAYYLNLSLFLAFARLYPNFELRIFFLIPVKVKWLAWISWGFFALQLFLGPLAVKAAITAALINYFIFFGKDIITNTKSTAVGSYRKQAYKSKFRGLEKDYHHKCTVCGRTELDDKDLEFRYCSKCDGHHEYCMDHLHDHEHIKNDKPQD